MAMSRGLSPRGFALQSFLGGTMSPYSGARQKMAKSPMAGEAIGGFDGAAQILANRPQAIGGGGIGGSANKVPYAAPAAQAVEPAQVPLDLFGNPVLAKYLAGAPAAGSKKFSFSQKGWS